MPVFTIDALKTLIHDNFPEAAGYTEITKLEENYLEIRLPFRDQFLRPGGTISGPTLMTLADTAAYYVILAHIGPVLLAVTTSLNIHFVRKPKPETLVGCGTLLKLGKQLAVVDIRVQSENSGELVAQATVTYSIPPQH